MKAMVKGLGIAILSAMFVFCVMGCKESEDAPPPPPSVASTPVDTVINIAAIQGIIVPANGLTPVTKIKENEQYSGTVTWNGNPSGFAASTIYTATITLTAKAGFTLQGVTANFFKVEGATSVSNAANSGVIKAVFPKTTAHVINSVEIDIIAPVKGTKPSTTATGTGDFTIGSVSWSPADNPFKGGETYTVSVTLTVKSDDFTFGLNSDSATINGQNAAISNNTGSIVTLSYTFPKTDTKTVTDIAIKTQPNNLIYTHGDTLNLTGLVVTLTHDDTTTEDVVAKDFTAKNITANPAAGNSLTYSIHNGQPVKITYGSLMPLNTSNLTVNKATPTTADFSISGTGTFTYDGNTKTVTITPREGKSTGTRSVKYNGSTTAPSDVSTYPVTFDVAETGDFNAANGLSAGTLTIVNATPKASDFNISGIGTVTYDGNPKIVTITPQVGKSSGTITVKYNGSETEPSVAASYSITFDVAAVTNFNAVTGLSAGTLTIGKATPTVTDFIISGTGEFSYDGNKKIVNVTAKDGKSSGTITVKYNGSTTAPSAIGTYTITFDVAAVTNFNAVTGLSAGTLTIKKATGAEVTVPTVNGSTTISSITVNAVTLQTATGQSIEYAISTSSSGSPSTWQSGTTFTGLNSGTMYYVYARSASNTNYNAGIASVSAGITTNTVSVTGVTLNQTTLSIATGSTATLTATIAPSNATNKNVTWNSSNTSIATVSSSGVVTAVAVGTANITVTTTDSNKTVTCVVTVKASSITSPKGIAMVWVADGSFQMGNPDTSVGDVNERPVHTVTLSGFYMGKYEVTQEQWIAVMGNNPSYSPDSPALGEVQVKRPVEQVKWYDTLVFCNKLSMLEGLSPAYRISGSTDPAVWGSDYSKLDTVEIVAGSSGYRLPTEAQWEYASRGGNGSPGNYTYSGSNSVGNVAWYWDNSGDKTHEIGKKASNSLGLYDMSGNVYEWCWDRNGDYSSGAQTNPVGAATGSERVRRGGSYYDHVSWLDSASFARSTRRDSYLPQNSNRNTGFRLVCP